MPTEQEREARRKQQEEREARRKQQPEEREARRRKRRKHLEDLRELLRKKRKKRYKSSGVHHHKRRHKHKLTMHGELTVSGTGEIIIPLRGDKPEDVTASFVGAPPPKIGCGPIVDDEVTITLERLLPFPIWQVRLSWNIGSGNIRGLEWSVNIIR